MKLIPVAILMTTIFYSCQRNVDAVVDPAFLPEQTLTDVSYGSDTKHKMDVYLPTSRSIASTKVMVLLHGGAWNEGDKADFSEYLASLKQRLPDYAIFNINYRLATPSTNHFPAQENDLKAAIDFVVSKSAEYKISEKIVLLGASAGAHLALLHGYKYTTPVKVRAIIDFFGPCDLTALYNASSPVIQFGLQSIIGATPTTNPTIYLQSSPITFVNPQSPPTLILQGGMDPFVDPAQSVSLKNKLQSEAVVHQYVFYPNEGHSWVGPNLTDSFDKIEAFLDANVN